MGEEFYRSKSYNKSNFDIVFVDSNGAVFHIDISSKTIKHKFKIDGGGSFSFYNHINQKYYSLINENRYNLYSFNISNNAVTRKKVFELSGLNIEESSLKSNDIENIYIIDNHKQSLYIINIQDFRVYKKSISQDLNLQAFIRNSLDGNIYGVDISGKYLIRFNIDTGDYEKLRINNTILSSIEAMFVDYAGYIYAISREEGNIYRLGVSYNSVEAEIFIKSNDLIRGKEKKCQEGIYKHNKEQRQDSTQTKIVKEISMNDIARGQISVLKDIDVLSLTIIKNSENGTFSINKKSGVWIYIPDEYFIGNDFVDLEVSVTSGKVLYFRILLNVIRASNMIQNHSKNSNRYIEYNVIKNKFLEGNCNLISEEYEHKNTYRISLAPKLGEVKLNSEEGTWRYEPFNNAIGEDEFIILLTADNGEEIRQTIKLKIVEPLLNIRYFVSEEFTFGLEIKHKIIIENIGQVQAKSIKVFTLLDKRLNLINDEIKVDGTIKKINNIECIHLEKIDCGRAVVVEFITKLASEIYDYNKVILAVNAKASFDCGKLQNFEFCSNKLERVIEYANIENSYIYASTNKVVTGDIVDFTIDFCLAGNKIPSKIKIYNLINKGTSILNNLININESGRELSREDKSILIDNVDESKYSISYSMCIDRIVKDELEFSPIIEYEYECNKKDIRRLHYIDEIRLLNAKPRIKVSKVVSKNCAILNDVVDIIISIKNEGMTSIESLKVKEIIGENLEYLGKLSIGDEESIKDLENGIVIDKIDSGKKVDIVYEAKVIGDKIVEKNCLTTIKYDYILSSNMFSLNEEIYESDFKILRYALDINREFSKKKVSVSEELYCNLEIINTGDIPINNIKLSYPILNDIEILEVKTDERFILGNLREGVKLESIGVQEKLNLYIKMKVIDSTKESENIKARITGNIKSSYDAKALEVEFTEKNNSFFEIINSKIIIRKEIDEEHYVVGDIANVKLIIKNTGDIEAENIIVTDILPSEFEFIEGSIILNDIKYSEDSIMAGIGVKRLQIGEELVVTYKFRVIEKTGEYGVKTSANASYTYIVEGQKRNSIEIISNECTLFISKIDIDISKLADKKFAVLGEIISYNIKITNNSDIDVVNVLFVDKISEEFELINRSFCINGDIVNNISLQKGIIIGGIKSGECKFISYKLRVVKTSINLKWDSDTFVKFAYILENGRISTGRVDLDIEEDMNIALSSFRNIERDGYFTIDRLKPEIEEIDTARAKVVILGYYIIPTAEVSSVDGQTLTGNKIIVYGYIKEIVEYIGVNNDKSIYSESYEIPFSDYIILPFEFKKENQVDIDGEVEDIQNVKVDKRTFFSSITLNLVAKILEG